MLVRSNSCEYNKSSDYKIFAPVFQTVQLFAFPLAENVSMQSPQETETEKAENCLNLSGFQNKLNELENGVNTEILKVIHDHGIDLSGGDKQKLALARALYKDAPIVVLDEPTAALDAIAESKLYEDFDKLIGGKTAVYISHRLSSTQFCKKVATAFASLYSMIPDHQKMINWSRSFKDIQPDTTMQPSCYLMMGEAHINLVHIDPAMYCLR